jgi:ABC-2 type transport system permease protein
MSRWLDGKVIWAMAQRTFRHSVDSPIAYVVAIFFYGFVGFVFGGGYFATNQASITSVSVLAPWVLWFVIPALTMGLISEELRSGTFESLSTLPVRDWEIVLGKFLGFAMLAGLLVAGLSFYAVLVGLTGPKTLGAEWGTTFGTLAALLALCLLYGAIGLFASSLAKSQVVCLIIGMVFCTIAFFIGQFYSLLPGGLGRIADAVGVNSHMETLSRGVWDIRDLFYFTSITGLFLYLTVQRLATRRF